MAQGAAILKMRWWPFRNNAIRRYVNLFTARISLRRNTERNKCSHGVLSTKQAKYQQNKKAQSRSLSGRRPIAPSTCRPCFLPAKAYLLSKTQAPIGCAISKRTDCTLLERSLSRKIICVLLYLIVRNGNHDGDYPVS